MRDLRGNYGLRYFSYVSAKLRNALPDFTRVTEFTGFKPHFVQRLFFLTNLSLFSYVSVYAMHFSCKCNVSKILALVVILK